MKIKQKYKDIVQESIAALLICLMVYAAASKLLDLPNFRVQLGQSPLLTRHVRWVIWAIPAIELLIAGCLLTSRWRTVGFYAAFGMMTMFSTYILAITQFSPFIPCSCGGILQRMSWNQHLVFNLFFVLLAVTAIGITDHPVKNILLQQKQEMPNT
jgi:hypothetical protein